MADGSGSAAGQGRYATLTLSFAAASDADALHVVAVSGTEALSTPFRFTVEFLSGADPERLRGALGKAARLALSVTEETSRSIPAHLVELTQGLMSGTLRRWTAVLAPWTWFHDLGRDSRLFQDVTSIKVAEQLLGGTVGTTVAAAPSTAVQLPPRRYAVQYGESDLHFVSRLLEDDGIFYFFRVAPAEDGSGRLEMRLGQESTEFDPAVLTVTLDPRGSSGTVHGWRHVYAVAPGGWSGRNTGPEEPRSPWTASVPGYDQRASGPQTERFEYPAAWRTAAGGFPDRAASTELANRRIQELEGAQRHKIVGEGACPLLSPGRVIRLQDVNGGAVADAPGRYVVAAVEHELVDEPGAGGAARSRYACRFVCLPNDRDADPQFVPFRPARRAAKPRIAGPQPAIVVGPKDAKIHTDDQRRVKVCFAWDRRASAASEDVGIWLRVADGWAGKGWGTVRIPHVGQEVLVSFLDGDPDRPLVTGRVYNNENAPPVPVTGTGTAAGGGGGFGAVLGDLPTISLDFLGGLLGWLQVPKLFRSKDGDRNRDARHVSMWSDDKGNEIHLDANEQGRIQLHGPGQESKIQIGKGMSSISLDPIAYSFLKDNTDGILNHTDSQFSVEARHIFEAASGGRFNRTSGIQDDAVTGVHKAGTTGVSLYSNDGVNKHAVSGFNMIAHEGFNRITYGPYKKLFKTVFIGNTLVEFNHPMQYIYAMPMMEMAVSRTRFAEVDTTTTVAETRTVTNSTYTAISATESYGSLSQQIVTLDQKVEAYAVKAAAYDLKAANVSIVGASIKIAGPKVSLGGP